MEVDLTDQVDKIATAVLSGTLALLVEGYPQAILIDARTYPVRGITEPDDDRVLRGSRDGFVETLVFNTALIRRRIRDPRLTMEILQIGKVSKTDVVVCYLDGRADPEIVERVKKELGKIDINSLNMGQESLSECLLRRQWFNPFPKIRYTERPGCRCRRRGGRPGAGDHRQHPRRHDFAYLPVRFRAGYQRLLFPAAGGHLPARRCGPPSFFSPSF